VKLLLRDPGWGGIFELELESVPAWKKKYSRQDHSLFITGSEQKADYFLTDGGALNNERKMMMLTASGERK
jgi:hypothetical protein